MKFEVWVEVGLGRQNSSSYIGQKCEVELQLDMRKSNKLLRKFRAQELRYWIICEDFWFFIGHSIR